MSIQKRDLTGVRDVVQEAKTSKAKAVYPFNVGSTPKDYVAIYDGNYGQAGLAFILDAFEVNGAKGLTEKSINAVMQEYFTQYKLASGRVDLPLYLSASSIVYALANKKALSDSALYGLAWALCKLPEDKARRLLDIADTATIDAHKPVKAHKSVKVPA